MSSVIAYIPFLTPMNFFHDWAFLLVLPLAFGISVIYKALRLGTLDAYWREVLIMTTQVVAGMIALGIALAVVVEWVIPALPIR